MISASNRRTNLLKSLPAPARKTDVRSHVSPDDVRLARLYGRHYYDGTRSQGYGGYLQDGRWDPVARDIALHLNYHSSETLCEIGCAKAFLVNSFVDQGLVAHAYGVDASLYALARAKSNDEVTLVHANAIQLPFATQSIHHFLSINSLHNFLDRSQLIQALSEIERVSIKTSFIRVAAYRTDQQKSVIDRWATAGRGYFHTDEWLTIFEQAGYNGFYDWWHPDPLVVL